MPRGSSPKREREYEKLKKEFHKEGRYKGREAEVAARIVNEQRSKFGETKEERRKDQEGKSPDRDLPIDRYQHLTVSQVKTKLDDLSDKEIRRIKRYEEQHKDRKTLLEDIERRL